MSGTLFPGTCRTHKKSIKKQRSSHRSWTRWNRSSRTSSLLCQAPALRRWQGPSTRTSVQDPMTTRNLSRAPPQVPGIRSLVAGPPPPAQVPMLPRWPVEVPPGLVDLMGHKVRQVLVSRTHCRSCQELPQHLVCPGPANRSTLSKEEQVPCGLPIELQDLHDHEPLRQGLRIGAPLQDPPAICQELVDDLQVLVLPPCEGRILKVLEPAQGREPDLWRLVPRGCRSLRTSRSCWTRCLSMCRRRRLIPPRHTNCTCRWRSSRSCWRNTRHCNNCSRNCGRSSKCRNCSRSTRSSRSMMCPRLLIPPALLVLVQSMVVHGAQGSAGEQGATGPQCKL